MVSSGAVFYALLGVWVLSVVTTGQDISCMETLMNEVASCFSAQNLSLQASGQQDAASLMREAQNMDPEIQCQHLDAYKKAINCTLPLMRSCLANVQLQGSIPDSAKFMEGMDQLCRRQDEFDSQCLREHYQHILDCGEETVKEVVKDKQDLTMEQVICLSADVNYDCSKKHLRDCGLNTMDIYLEQQNNYMVPPACANKPPGRAGRKSYVTMSVTGGDSGRATTLACGGLALVASLVLQFFMH